MQPLWLEIILENLRNELMYQHKQKVFKELYYDMVPSVPLYIVRKYIEEEKAKKETAGMLIDYEMASSWYEAIKMLDDKKVIFIDSISKGM